MQSKKVAEANSNVKSMGTSSSSGNATDAAMKLYTGVVTNIFALNAMMRVKKSKTAVV